MCHFGLLTVSHDVPTPCLPVWLGLSFLRRTFVCHSSMVLLRLFLLILDLFHDSSSFFGTPGAPNATVTPLSLRIVGFGQHYKSVPSYIPSPSQIPTNGR